MEADNEKEFVPMLPFQQNVIRVSSQEALGRTEVTLYEYERLVIRVAPGEDSGLRSPFITQIMADDHDMNFFSFKADTLPTGFQLSWLVLKNTGFGLDFGKVLEMAIQGNILEEGIPALPWSFKFQLTLEKGLRPPTPLVEDWVFIPEPAVARQLTIFLSEGHYRIDSRADPSSPIILGLRDLVCVHVAPDGPGLTTPGITAIGYQLTTRGQLGQTQIPTRQNLPPSLVVASVALKNNGLMTPPGLEYYVSFCGSVVHDGTIKSWFIDPEMVLKTSGGGGGPVDEYS